MTLLDAGGLIFLITINAVSIGTPKITLGKSTKEKEIKANLHLIFAKKIAYFYFFSSALCTAPGSLHRVQHKQNLDWTEEKGKSAEAFKYINAGTIVIVNS